MALPTAKHNSCITAEDQTRKPQSSETKRIEAKGAIMQLFQSVVTYANGVILTQVSRVTFKRAQSTYDCQYTRSYVSQSLFTVAIHLPLP